MTGKKPTAEGTVLLQLRRKAGWTQARLERTARLSRGVISLYETGRRPLNRQLLKRLAGTLGCALEDVEQELGEFAQTAPNSDSPPALTPAYLFPHERRAIEVAAERAAARVRLRIGIRVIETRVRSERLEAANQWVQLRKLPTFRIWRERIDADPRLRSWALCELLCEESVQAAGRDARIASNLARLALRIAEKLPGRDSWSSRVQGYAWAFVANARRVEGNLDLASQALLRSGDSWEAGRQVNPAPLDEWQVPRMAAGLLGVQGQLEKARSLLAIAIQNTDIPESRASVLLQLARLLERQGATEEWQETLRLAEEVIPVHRLRLKFGMEFSRTSCLCQQGRFEDASKRLIRVQRLSLHLGYPIDVTRARWLSARVLAGLERTSEAIAHLKEVRQFFLLKNMSLDANLASLEIEGLQPGIG